MSQVIPFLDIDLEKLYSYVRFLLTKLPPKDSGASYRFDEEVNLKYYRLQKISEGRIELQKGKGGEVSGPTDVGTGVVKGEQIELSRLIDILNDRFGTEFKPGDQLYFDSIVEDAVSDSTLQQAALANTMENFGYVFLKTLEGLFIERMDQNEEITAQYLNNQEFQKIVGQNLLKRVYDQIHKQKEKEVISPL
jgi:type I restriction enzyme R subunit